MYPIDYRLKITTAQLNARNKLEERYPDAKDTEDNLPFFPWSAFEAPRGAYVIVPEHTPGLDYIGFWAAGMFHGIEPDGYIHT